ncbi:AGE family epimerase/isomerase [Epibacterium ulvae]|nr:AGE family epimerase/isomerase [Epibacterium ulvae]
MDTTLRDAKTGLMLEHDALEDPAAADAPYGSQNPHMHLYEVALQAFEMTQNPVWLERAGKMRAKGLEYFFDAETGSMTEFIAADLSVEPGADGERRDIGHQCEWAWLLTREAELGGDPKSREIADRLTAFAQSHGYATENVMSGAVYDAVANDLGWTEERFRLWPQTEAIKADVVRAADPVIAKRAQRHALRMFQRYFAGYAGYVYQLDASGNVIWDEGLSRLLYHIVVAMTEGARMGLWQGPGVK